MCTVMCCGDRDQQIQVIVYDVGRKLYMVSYNFRFDVVFVLVVIADPMEVVVKVYLKYEVFLLL